MNTQTEEEWVELVQYINQITGTVMNKTIYVSTTFATVLLTINSKDVIISSPPVFKTWIGKQYSAFYNYYSSKNKIVKTEIMKNGALKRV